MTPEEFVQLLRERAIFAAVRGTNTLLERPPGRKPSDELIQASNWYHSLADNDRQMLSKAINMAAYQAVFGVLAILDGVRKVEDDSGELTFSLRVRSGEHEDELVGVDTPHLHDILAHETPAR